MGRRLGAGPMLLPGIAWLAIFFLLPLAIILIVSVGDNDRFGRILLDAPSLDNYAAAVDPVLLPAVLNSFRYAAATTILCLAIGYPVAYWISRYGGHHKTLLLVLVMQLGLLAEPVILLNTDLAVILGMTYGFLPFAILPLFVSIDRLDDSIVAAARDLYANGRSAFLHVTLPLTMPGVIAASILTFIPAIGDYVTPELLGGAQTTTIAKIIQNQFLGARDWPAGAALGFLMMAVTIIASLVAIRTLRREVLG
jgi:spermidine/putrescine transport system permease protein